MFVNAAVPLLFFSLALLWTKVQVQECQSCNNSCYWDSCCEMKCTDNCNLTFSCQIHNETTTAGNTMFRWCTVEVKDTHTSSLINITVGTSSPCTICNNENDMCCDSDDTLLRINCSTLSIYSALTPSSRSSDVTPPVSNLLKATPSSGFPATSTFIISTVIPAVVGTALLFLMVAAVLGSILLALALCKTKRKKFPVTSNSDEISQQRMDNTYSAVQTTNLSSTDVVYSTLDREQTTTEIPRHLNTPALPTYSSLADVQQNSTNIENLPLNYDMVRLENMSKNKTVVIDQDSAEVIRVQPAAVYSTVVRQNGKKMTVKLDTPNTLVEERNAE